MFTYNVEVFHLIFVDTLCYPVFRWGELNVNDKTKDLVNEQCIREGCLLCRTPHTSFFKASILPNFSRWVGRLGEPIRILPWGAVHRRAGEGGTHSFSKYHISSV